MDLSTFYFFGTLCDQFLGYQGENLKLISQQYRARSKAWQRLIALGTSPPVKVKHIHVHILYYEINHLCLGSNGPMSIGLFVHQLMQISKSLRPFNPAINQSESCRSTDCIHRNNSYLLSFLSNFHMVN